MKLKQKAIVLFLTLLTVFSVSGCFFDNTSDSSSAELATATQTEITEPQATEPPKQLDEFYHSYNSISDDSVKKVYALIDEYASKRYPVPFNVNEALSLMQLDEAMYAYINDHPESFWLERNFAYEDYTQETKMYISFNITLERKDEAEEKFNSVINNIISKAPQNSSDYEKELYINNYLIENCEYDKSAVDNEDYKGNAHNAYGALVEKKAVCEGYARAFQLLCNRLGIDCVFIYGTAEGSGHAWNCVKLDDNWYQADVTWNDTNDKDEACKNTYLNLTDSQMYTEHTAAKLFFEISESEYEDINFSPNLFLPKCTSEKYNYFRQSCVTLKSINDGDKLAEAIAQAAKDNSKYFSFVIDDGLDYNGTADMIIYDGYLADWIDSANWKNWYSPNLNNTCNVYKNEINRVITCKLEYN